MEYIEKKALTSTKQTVENKNLIFLLCQGAWRSRWTADISLLVVALIWGTTYVASKDVLSSVPVLEFLFIRFLMTTVLMLPLTINAIRKADRHTWTSGISFGLFLLAIFTLETFGVANTSASNAGFIISLFAVMVPIIHSIVYRVKPKLSLLIVVVLSVAGTAMLTLHGYHLNLGDFLILGAAFCRALQMTFTKKITDGKEMNSGALTTIQLGVVAIGSGFLSIFQKHPDLHLTLSFWLIIGFLAVFATMFAFFVQMVMIRRTSPSRVAVLMSSEPIFAALASVVLLGEHLSIISIIGGASIVTGMLWARKLT